MSFVKGSFMALHSVDTPTDSMWNDLMTELESSLDLLVPQKNKRQSAMDNKYTKETAKQTQKKLLKKPKGSSKFSRASQCYKAYKGFVQRQTLQ